MNEEFTIRDDFPAVDYDQWRAMAEGTLGGVAFDRKLVTRTYEGIDLQPLYTRRDGSAEENRSGLPGLPPYIRGARPAGSVQTGWDLRQEHAHPDLDASREAIDEDVRGGVTSLLIRLDYAARNGLDPDDPHASDFAGRDGAMVYDVDDFDHLLANVSLDRVGLSLEAGAAFLPAAAMLAGLWERRGVKRDSVRGAFNADPLAVLSRDGQLPVRPAAALSTLADLAAWTSGRYPYVTAVRVGTAAYHHAGATAAQDIAFAIATGVEYLRAMTGAGMNVAAAAEQILFSMALGTHQFLAIAKLRAVRKLWSRVVSQCGAPPEAGAMQLHARISKRVLTRRAPQINLLRNTAAVFAAGLGGADSITSTPMDAAIGLPDQFTRRIARNTMHVLQEEGGLNRVIDPLGGSWYVESLTREVAEKAWPIFQDIQRQGGMLDAITSGWVGKQIESAFLPRAERIAQRKDSITGVSQYPSVGEPTIARPAPDYVALRKTARDRLAARRPDELEAAAQACLAESTFGWAGQGASIGQLAGRLGFKLTSIRIPPLAPHIFAAPFEDLRDASDRWHAAQGRRPQVFLANMGPIAQHSARATYATGFFEAGGFEVLSNAGFEDASSAAEAFQQSDAKIAVICSSDTLYQSFARSVASALKKAGARTVVLAGSPGPNEPLWREAGVDRFIFIKCDVLTILQDLLREEGVL